jgi:aspartate dehydrogenase
VLGRPVVSDHGDDAGSEVPAGWLHADEPLVGGSGLTGRLRRWLLIDGNRWLLAGFVFASVLVVGTLDGGIRATVRSTDPIETAFSGLATGIITGVTLIVTIDQLVLSQQLGSLAEQRERLDESLRFHREVEQLVEGTSPAEPGRFLAAIVDRAVALAEASAGSPPDLAAAVEQFVADPEVEDRLTDLATASEHDLYLPHAALFGIDGLVDAGDTLQSVHIEARKAPDHLDFEYADAVDPAAVEGGTVLHEGPTRGLCQRFPRNFNSHAAMALAGLGLDATTSRLIVDSERASAKHVVTATGPGFELEAVRDSAIEGVTGDYTLVSTWGSVRRVLGVDEGPRFL